MRFNKHNSLDQRHTIFLYPKRCHCDVMQVGLHVLRTYKSTVHQYTFSNVLVTIYANYSLYYIKNQGLKISRKANKVLLNEAKRFD